MFDNFHNLRIAVSFPEFKGSDYCIREMVRTVESLPMLSLMPDGCDVHDSRNYNKGTPEYVQKIYTMLQNARLAPPWVNDQWLKDQREYMKQQASFIIRELWVTGGYPHWGLLRPETGVFVGQNPYLKRYVPEAFADPDNAKIISNVFDDGKAGAPQFHVRRISVRGLLLRAHAAGPNRTNGSTCPARGRSRRSRIPTTTASVSTRYGRHLLANTGASTPVTVDGCSQISDGSYRAAPESYRQRHLPARLRPRRFRQRVPHAAQTPLAHVRALRRAGRRLHRALCAARCPTSSSTTCRTSVRFSSRASWDCGS